MYELLKKGIKKIIPHQVIHHNENIIRKIISINYRGNKFECNVCDFKMSRFIKLSNGELLCPRCGTLPRTRRLNQLLKENIDLKGKKMLHFSPPKGLSNRLNKIESLEYITTDYVGEFNANKRLDITNINEKEGAYDIIICYHVLEHIEKDKQAIKELYRILKKGGKCIIQTPFKNGEIYEDFNIKTSKERLIHFGQEDHVRIYSVAGLKGRLMNGGFKVEILELKESEENRNGFKRDETILMAIKD